MVVMLGFGSQANAQTASNLKQQLIEGCATANKSCPIDLGEGIVMTAVKYSEPNCVFNFLTNFDDEQIQMINLMSDTMSDVMLESLGDDSGTKSLLNLCKQSKTNMLIVFRNKSGSNANIIIPYSKM